MGDDAMETNHSRVDTLIDAGWIVPVEPAALVLRNHSIAIRNGKILDLLPTSQALGKYRAEQHVALPHHLLIPGLINAHTHAAMSLLRGYADDLPLLDWLQQHIWPAEQRLVDADFVRLGGELAIAEMISSGTTCFADMYFFPEQTARAAIAAGMRAIIGLVVIDFPNAWAATAEEHLHKGIRLHDELKQEPLIRTMFAPHAPYTVSAPTLEQIAVLAEEMDIPIQTHLHETSAEIEHYVQTHHLRPLEHLHQLGLVSPRLLAVHATDLRDAEIALLAEQGASVLHCPESNMKLASGICPVDRLQKAGVNLALGTDGAASNNNLDLLGEMHSAALLAKVGSGDPTLLPAFEVLRMATLGGAKALGLEAISGSLRAGKAADITALDMSNYHNIPIYHIVSQLVYASGKGDVSDVWIAGRRVLQAGELTTLDGEKLRSDCGQWLARTVPPDTSGG